MEAANEAIGVEAKVMKPAKLGLAVLINLREAWLQSFCLLDRNHVGLRLVAGVQYQDSLKLSLPIFNVAHRDLCTRNYVGAYAAVQQVETRNE